MEQKRIFVLGINAIELPPGLALTISLQILTFRLIWSLREAMQAIGLR